MDYRSALERIIGEVDRRIVQVYPSHNRLYIANPRAGTRYRHLRTVGIARALTGQRAEACDVRPVKRTVAWTETAAEAVKIVRSTVLSRYVGEPIDSDPTIVISLGGDGTHNHCLAAGIDSPGEVLFLRVPLGSGNDATDVSLEEFFARLGGDFVERWNPAVEVIPSGRGTPRYFAFNIASLGIDAFITAMHDRWRRILPGNTYRLLVNLAVLRYERLVDLKPSTLKVISLDGRSIETPFERRTLIVFGASGHRTYGDHMQVLPGDDNVCVMGSAGLRDKLRMKRLFFQGEHVHEAITSMYRAQEVVVDYSGDLPIQVDGEASWIHADEFPLRIRLRERGVRVIDPHLTRSD